MWRPVRLTSAPRVAVFDVLCRVLGGREAERASHVRVCVDVPEAVWAKGCATPEGKRDGPPCPTTGRRPGCGRGEQLRRMAGLNRRAAFAIPTPKALFTPKRLATAETTPRKRIANLGLG